MKFSVLVPVYNVEKYLSKCIESILNQSYLDFEIILVIDGSPDNSIDICKKYAKMDSRVIYVEKENGGPLSARKLACKYAKGDYTICVDGDDYIHRDLLFKLNYLIEKNNDLDLICYGFYKDNNGEISKAEFNNISEGVYSNSEYLTQYYLFDKNKNIENNGCLQYMLWTKCVKSEIYTESQSNVPDYIKNGEDILCTANILPKVKNYAIMDFAGYYYRYNEKSLTHVRESYDLINVSNVKDELLKIGVYPRENIAHLYLNSIYVLMRDISKLTGSYTDFKKYIEILNFDKSFCKNKFYKHFNIKQRLKYKIMEKQHWFLFYHLVYLLKL